LDRLEEALNKARHHRGWDQASLTEEHCGAVGGGLVERPLYVA
jgi:hypothetical protein